MGMQGINKIGMEEWTWLAALHSAPYSKVRFVSESSSPTSLGMSNAVNKKTFKYVIIFSSLSRDQE